MSAPVGADAHGLLDVGDGHELYFETSGNPAGVPAVVLHGGPGSGCRPWHRRLFDPAAYRVVLYDQRGSARSRPHAGETAAALEANTTWHLVADLERLRQALGVERWLVLGGSWGSLLALAYAEAHAERVLGLVLHGVVCGRRAEFDWLFRGGLGRFLPAEWEAFLAALPPDARAGDPVEAYHRLLLDPVPAVHDAAAVAWCRWESATPDWPPAEGLSPRFADPAHRLAFARLVTHYARNDAWIEDGQLVRGLGALAGIEAVLVNGRFDLQSPLGNAWELRRAWPGRSELVVVGDAGHAPTAALEAELVRATDRFAASLRTG